MPKFPIRVNRSKRAVRVALWRKLVGARPAWLITLALTIFGGCLREYVYIRERITTQESSIVALRESTDKAQLAIWASIQRNRDMFSAGCRK